MIRGFRGTRLGAEEGEGPAALGTSSAASEAMRGVLELVRRIAPHDVGVCIEGETGSGKELVAARIHRLSPRAHESLVTLNCGAIPDSLLESELFGHERGAFTGADRRRLGKFELAHRGTLFLDEVADLSPRPRWPSSARSSSARSPAWAARGPSGWMCGSSPPRTRGSPGWSARAASGRTSITGSMR